MSISLTYCGNVHPAADLRSWMEVIDSFAVPLAAARREAGYDFGLGTWWNSEVAASLVADPARSEQVRSFLAERGLTIWTMNVFPFGEFHGTRVKERVYHPDWSTEERLLYTRRVATAVALLGSDREVVPLSTLPLGYRPKGCADEELRLMARNLVRAASHLHAVREEHGQTMVLALEPEPFCLLETVAQTAEFLERWVFRAGSWTVSEAVLRRHLGVCVDLCHLAVVREDPVTAVADLRARGIADAKVQVSACLELRDPAGIDELLGFDEDVYLHQSVADRGARALDLPELNQRRGEFERGGIVRTHFHTPVFWDREGALGSTRSELERVLPALPRPLPLLEVETYTWDVLPDPVRREESLLRGLERELSWVCDTFEG